MRALVLSVLPAALTLCGAVAAQAQQAPSLLCAVVNVVECSAAGGECQRATLESANIPRFLKLNPAAKTVAATGDDTRTAPIHNVEHMNDRWIMHGGQQGRAWSATVGEKTGQMSVAVVEDQVAFVIFGACTPVER